MYKMQNLTPFANNGKKGRIPMLWVYWNEDNDTITTAGFFPTVGDLTNGDQILMVNGDYASNKWYNVSIANNVITLVANN